MFHMKPHFSNEKSTCHKGNTEKEKTISMVRKSVSFSKKHAFSWKNEFNPYQWIPVTWVNNKFNTKNKFISNDTSL